MPTGRGEERLVVEPQEAVCQDRIFLSLKPFLQKNRQGTPLPTFALYSLLVRLALLVRNSMHTCVLQKYLKSELKAVYIESETLGSWSSCCVSIHPENSKLSYYNLPCWLCLQSEDGESLLCALLLKLFFSFPRFLFFCPSLSDLHLNFHQKHVSSFPALNQSPVFQKEILSFPQLLFLRSVWIKHSTEIIYIPFFPL